ncbi:helix-turn-helix domain-containing protein [Saccharothrix sp. Mg75]|uniref:helix-turn-helix domain-containing protein n=1 Tax=Saccharothrix sp. Mg75 TaxID=3445357 RepID=UPI003EEDCE19
MPDSAGGVGRRVRYWRLRRNLGRKQFADMVGRSTSWLDKVESGERDLSRIPVIELVADALAIDPGVLTDAPAAARAAGCVDAAEVSALRAALGRYPGLSTPDSEPAGVAQLARQADYVDHAWASSHFTTVARHLPTLLQAAQRAALAAPPAERVDAHRVLISAYRLASSMLLKFESHDIAWLAATRSVARAMTAAGQRTEAVEALLGMSERMRPEVTRHLTSLLSLHGMLHLAAAITAAEQDDASLALAMHREATRAAERMERHYDTHHTHFGRANVAVHRVAALVRLHEAGAALDVAATIPRDALAGLPPERRASHLLDLTEANARRGGFAEATRTLARAERTAPQEVRCRPLAHGLLRVLLSNTAGEPARLVRQMAARAGVPA